MECLNTTKNLKINKNKSIGEIIILVEGESEEFKILKHIFTKVLDYNLIEFKRKRAMPYKFISKTNSNNTVIVANTINSNIKSIMENTDYQDKIYELLRKDYNKSLKNIPIYIIWDRDYDSNDEKIVLKILNTFRSSLDNGEDMNGLLLLSYPCIESYEISNFNKQLYKLKFRTSDEAKSKFKEKRYSINKITEKTLLNAVGNLHRSMLNYKINKYDTSNFYNVNKNIFDIETKTYKKYNYFNAISLFSILLIDLGIIYEEKE